MRKVLHIFGWIFLGIVSAFLLVVGAALLGSEWGYNILLAFDQYHNAVFGGHPDETISSRLGKWLSSTDWMRRYTAEVLCAFLDIFDSNHCVNSIDHTIGGKDAVK